MAAVKSLVRDERVDRGLETCLSRREPSIPDNRVGLAREGDRAGGTEDLTDSTFDSGSNGESHAGVWAELTGTRNTDGGGGGNVNQRSGGSDVSQESIIPANSHFIFTAQNSGTATQERMGIS